VYDVGSHTEFFELEFGWRVPKGEILWSSYLDSTATPEFILTSKENENRQFYYLYAIKGNSLTKLGKAKTPPELEEKFGVHKKKGSKL
jgi:hypothetical protein